MPTYDLTYNLTNCKKGKTSATQIVVDGKTSNKFSLVANYGYIFSTDKPPVVRRKKSSGDFYEDAFYESGLTTDKKTWNDSFSFRDTGTTNLPPFSIIAETVRDSTVTLRTLNITNNIPNSTVEYEQTSSTDFNIKLTCANGFTGTPQITYTNDYGSERTKEMPVSGNVAAITVSIDVYSDDVTFSYKQDEPKTIPVTYNLSNCSVVGKKPDSVLLNSTLSVTIQATGNATLKTVQIAYPDDYGFDKTVDGEIDETGKTGVVSFTPKSTSITYIEVRATATTDEPTIKSYGSINVYNVTLENLNDFAQKRFFTATVGTNSLVDLGVYVNRIKRVFVDVPTSGTDTLKCGNYDTKISVLSPNTDVVTVDFGNVTLTGENENSHDYDTRIKLFVPFFGFVDVDSSYMNKTVNLTAKINIITGNGIIQLSCDGVPFHFENVSFSRDVIFRTSKENYEIVGGDKWDELNLYGFEPYFIINSTRTVEIPVNDTKELVTIGNVTGYAQFENVNLNTANLLVDEYDEIISQLETGVYL